MTWNAFGKRRIAVNCFDVIKDEQLSWLSEIDK